mmetsp:Transcript_56617/g.104803  ORF Transcript_56617/g.104803 Transcript_56617/m.104803 type:complete len:188 (-) Transcript_56617:67-630(-)
MGATSCRESTCHESAGCWCKEQDRSDMHIVTAEGLNVNKSANGAVPKIKAYRDLEDEAIDVANSKYDAVEEVPKVVENLEEEEAEEELAAESEDKFPDTFVAEIQKQPKEKLGLMITNFPTKERICVRGVAVGGAIQRWNTYHPEATIEDGHYLLEINDIVVAHKREEEIVNLLAESAKIKLLISRK